MQNGRRAGELSYPLINECLDTFEAAVNSYAALKSYIDAVVNAIRLAGPGTYFDSSLHEIVYFLLGLEPFRTWQNDPAKRFRLGKLTELIEAFSSMPVPGYPNISRGSMRISTETAGQLVPGWVRQFYHLFVGYLDEAGLDDIQDDEVICPTGMVPIMTIHQAKGLEFPFVFVGHAGANTKPSDTHELEEYFDPYPINPTRAFSRAPASERAELDMIRQYFVAYSRAQYALIIVGSTDQIRRKVTIPCGPTKNWLVRRSINI